MALSRGAPICPKITNFQIFGSFLLITVAVAVGAPFDGAGGTKSSRSICLARRHAVQRRVDPWAIYLCALLFSHLKTSTRMQKLGVVEERTLQAKPGE